MTKKTQGQINFLFQFWAIAVLCIIAKQWTINDFLTYTLPLRGVSTLKVAIFGKILLMHLHIIEELFFTSSCKKNKSHNYKNCDHGLHFCMKVCITQHITWRYTAIFNRVYIELTFAILGYFCIVMSFWYSYRFPC